MLRFCHMLSTSFHSLPVSDRIALALSAVVCACVRVFSVYVEDKIHRNKNSDITHVFESGCAG